MVAPLTFSDRVRRIVAKIPEGETLSYGEVARRAGSPAAARAVGAAMSKNFDPKIPCHRVIGSDGSPRGYNRGGPSAKLRLLASERRTLDVRTARGGGGKLVDSGGKNYGRLHRPPKD